MRILLVEDDRALIDVLSIALTEQNYAIDVVTDGEKGWTYGSTYNYDLIVLDWLLPKLDGISLCRRFRDRGNDTPILLLTSRNNIQDKIKGLDAGADDYICKPVDLEELMARIRALLRRINSNHSPLLTWGDLQLEPRSCEVRYRGELITLTAKEYALLELFLRHSHEVLSIEEIINSLWSSVEYPSEATVRSHLRRLRHKLKQAGLAQDPIETVQGRGYALKSLNLVEGDSNTPPTPADSQPDKQSRHLAALMGVWEKYRERSKQQLITLQETVRAAKIGNLNQDDRQTAIFTAHNLAGNLGMFGFDRGSQLAQELEKLLRQETTIDANANSYDISRQEGTAWQTILDDLQQELNLKEDDDTADACCCLSQHQPLLLIVDDNIPESTQLALTANNEGIETIVFQSPESAANWSIGRSSEELPSLALIKLSCSDANSTASLAEQHPEAFSLIAELKLLEPSIPSIVVSERDRFQDRLQVVRHGGCFYLKQPLTPKQIVSYCQQTLQRSSFGKRIAIVDDDIELLRSLPSLLQPWGFKLTTLHDPRQFWDVLSVVHPDLLILDIEMPYLSGIELCQVLRSHPYWCKIPIIFLTVHQDPSLRDRVFTIGADDLIYKPIVAKQLASRIVNHLGRSRLV
jgi:DNA-binding response OmpR family regulator